MNKEEFDINKLSNDQLFNMIDEIKLRYIKLNDDYSLALLKIHKEEKRHRDKNKRRYDRLKIERQLAIDNKTLIIN